MSGDSTRGHGVGHTVLRRYLGGLSEGVRRCGRVEETIQKVYVN